MLIKQLYKIENFSELKKEVLDLVNAAPEGISQIICQGLTEDTEDWSTGTGKVDKLEIKDEKQYKFINKNLKGSRLEEIVNFHNAYRTRIMIMDSVKCYSIHHDLGPRLHVPIVSNLESYMIWPQDSICCHLSPGYTYWTDTTKNHTFINGGSTRRIHLVMCVD